MKILFKAFLLGIMLCLAFSIPAFCGNNSALSLTLPAGWTIGKIALLLVGVYDVIARAIPTVNNISVLHWIIELLRWASVNLNQSKK